MEFWYTRRFLRSLKKLPSGVQEDVAHAIDRFADTQNHRALELHKLSGRLKKYHAFSANFSHRVVVEIRKGKIYFINVGTHDIYQ